MAYLLGENRKRKCIYLWNIDVRFIAYLFVRAILSIFTMIAKTIEENRQNIRQQQIN